MTRVCDQWDCPVPATTRWVWYDHNEHSCYLPRRAEVVMYLCDKHLDYFVNKGTKQTRHYHCMGRWTAVQS